MARPARPERSRSARSSRQLSRFYHSINPDRVFGTHTDPQRPRWLLLKDCICRSQTTSLKYRLTDNEFRFSGFQVAAGTRSQLQPDPTGAGEPSGAFNDDLPPPPE